MTDNITLPRAVAFEMLEALTCGSSIRHQCQHCGGHIGNFRAALDAALAEPDAIARAVEAEREAICPIVYGLCISDNNAQEIVNAIRARGSK
jgi:hypothetical protein